MSMVMFATLCDRCKRRSEEYIAWPTCKDCGEHICSNCDIETECTEDERDHTLCVECRVERAQEDPDCECVRVDVDRDDNRHCPAHGPNSPAAKRQREQEAADEWAFWNGGLTDVGF